MSCRASSWHCHVLLVPWRKVSSSVTSWNVSWFTTGMPGRVWWHGQAPWFSPGFGSNTSKTRWRNQDRCGKALKAVPVEPHSTNHTTPYPKEGEMIGFNLPRQSHHMSRLQFLSSWESPTRSRHRGSNIKPQCLVVLVTSGQARWRCTLEVEFDRRKCLFLSEGGPRGKKMDGEGRWAWMDRWIGIFFLKALGSIIVDSLTSISGPTWKAFALPKSVAVDCMQVPTSCCFPLGWNLVWTSLCLFHPYFDCIPVRKYQRL